MRSCKKDSSSKKGEPKKFCASPKQKLVFKWWTREPTKSLDGIICDGAVRSGKTMCMSYSFLLWAMSGFNGKYFAVCGKTISSVKRNILGSMTEFAKQMGMKVVEKASKNYLDISYGRISNRFYIFGGKDESSAALIQGMTLCGVLFDETALMPRSFVEQAVARCSAADSKIWFNCNPENSAHWFKREWIDKAQQKHIYRLHFTLDDNPSLSKRVKDRYKRLYTGTFYERFILGKWCDVSGLIYPMFSEKLNVVKTLPESFDRYMISCDYGTVNPSSFGLWGRSGRVWFRISEYYFDSRKEGRQKTDEEHYAALEELAGSSDIEKVIVDPSAASFIECIRRHGKFVVKPAKNDVLSGIRRVADRLTSGEVKFSAGCEDCIREFSLYRWDDSAAADRPLKENDHAMDEVRYFVTEAFGREDQFFVMSLER